jgi:Flp pilus assembly protein TadD
MAIAKGATASISTLTLIKGALKIMAWTKAKTVVVAAVMAVVLSAGTVTVILVERNSGDSGQYTQEGWKLLQDGKRSEATAMFQKAIKRDPKNPEAWNGLGWATFNSGNSPDAEKDFQKVLSLNPTHGAALNGLGQIYLAQKRYDEAEIVLLQADVPAAWFGLARIYLLQGKFGEAEKWAQKLADSGQGDQTANDMLQAAKDKRLPEKLRMTLKPR